MDIKYNVSKFKDSKIQEVKDSVSIEEPLEMSIKYKKNNKWEIQNISITNDNSGQEYYIHSAGYQLPLFSASCTFETNSMEQLGMTTLSAKVASCNLAATQNERFSGSVLLITSMGEYVSLEESQFSIPANSSESFSVNSSNWKPDAGEITLTLLIIDSYGRQIETTTKEVIARSSGWNIGIAELSANGDIRVSIARESYQRLVGVTCLLTVESPDSNWEGETQIIDLGGIDYAPIIKIDDPGVLDKDDLIKADLSCIIPYDIDDNPDDDDFSSDSSENEETFDKVEDDDIANNGKDVDYVIDKEVEGILSDKIQDTRKVNRRLDAFLLLHDEHTTSNYESLLHGLFINCCSNGEKKHEFSSATWKSFNIDLKKYDKSYKMKAKECLCLSMPQ